MDSVYGSPRTMLYRSTQDPRQDMRSISHSNGSASKQCPVPRRQTFHFSPLFSLSFPPFLHISIFFLLRVSWSVFRFKLPCARAGDGTSQKKVSFTLQMTMALGAKKWYIEKRKTLRICQTDTKLMQNLPPNACQSRPSERCKHQPTSNDG